MRVKRKLSRDRSDQRSFALQDARELLLELAGFAPSVTFDSMKAGVVLEVGETAFRLVGAWLQQCVGGAWVDAAWSHVLITDRRLLVRLDAGQLISLWWGSLVGFHVDLAGERLTLDYGDGCPWLVSGPAIPVIAVGGVANIYGVEALLRHPALEAVRTFGAAAQPSAPSS